jgi:hypothetical protein
MLLSLVAQQVVTTRETLEITAPTEGAVEGILGRRLRDVFPLVPDEIFGVQETLITKIALVWPFRVIEMCLFMTTSKAQHVSINDQLHQHLSRT